MGIFPVEFPTTTADSFESFRVLHYLAFIKRAGRKSWRSIVLLLFNYHLFYPNILLHRLLSFH